MLVNRHRKLFTSLVRLTATATAMLMLTVLIVTHSEAAFSDTTDNTANSFATGSVILNDDDSGSAMFSVSDMSPGSPVVECIDVTYTGSIVPATVRMYGASGGTGLAGYLDTTIEMGTGGVFGDCSSFVPSGPAIYVGTIDGFSTAHSNWATGLATFAPAANPDNRVFRITVDVQNDPLAQGLTATADFTFEAQD